MSADGSGPAHVSYLRHANFRWLKVAAALCAVSLLAYLIETPAHGHGGGTVVGYALGTLAALLVFWLAWYGVRKRSFRTGQGPARGWVSAHVYLGIAVLWVASLHSGFHLGFNVHTLAYALLWLVVVSGLYGVAAYAVLPARITENRKEEGPRVMLEEIAKLNDGALRLADTLDAQTQQIIARSVSRVRVGGTAWQQLTGRYPTQADPRALAETLKGVGEAIKATTASRKQAAAAPMPKGRQQKTMFFVADQLFDAGGGKDSQREGLRKLLEMIGRRNAFIDRLNRDITLRARLEIWLYFHVPLAVTLLAAVIAHIVSVFFYR